MVIAELDLLVGEVEDGLEPRPARLDIAEQAPRSVGQPVGLAIAAAEQVDEDVVGQLVDRGLGRAGYDAVLETAVLDDEIIGDDGLALG